MKNIKYLFKDTVLFTNLNSWFKHDTQHWFKQILSINDNSWKNRVDFKIYDEEINENMIEKFVNFHDDDSDVYDLSYVVNWTIILDDRKISHDSDTKVFNHASEFDFELWCNDQSRLIFNWCINWNYMHFRFTIKLLFIALINQLRWQRCWKDVMTEKIWKIYCFICKIAIRESSSSNWSVHEFAKISVIILQMMKLLLSLKYQEKIERYKY